MYKYIKDDNNNNRTDIILRLIDNAYIPNNIENRDWVAYLAWLAEGNTPEEA